MSSRLLSSALACSLLGTFLLVPRATFAAGETTFTFAPPCIREASEKSFGGPTPNSKYLVNPGEGNCPLFAVRDPLSLQTDELALGAEFNIILTISNPSEQSIARFRTWLTYDPSVLSIESVELIPPFASPLPGELNAVTSEGFIKVSGSAPSAVKSVSIPVARIKGKVLATTSSAVGLIAHNASGNADAKTAIFTKLAESETNVLRSLPTILYVRLKQSVASLSQNTVTAAAVTASSATVTTAQQSGMSQSVPAQQTPNTGTPSTSGNTGTAFASLRVSGLRITTEGSSLYLAWTPLPSSELVGYNIYYGTVSGRYAHRRSVDKSARTMTIRALPIHETYYVAIRGFNSANTETDFSDEVAVTIGRPGSSTSPLNATVLPDDAPVTPPTDGSVEGESGAPSMIVLAAVVIAIVGTAFALRRQFTATTLT